MSYELYIGDRVFSSWSMRVWLIFEKFNLPFTLIDCDLYGDKNDLRSQLESVYPAKTVPAVKLMQGGVLTDSLALAETLVEAHPHLPLYPKKSSQRALARSIVGEIHSNFSGLYKECPNNLNNSWSGFELSSSSQDSLTRITELWDIARGTFTHDDDGPWLFGSYTIADAFSAPIAARIATYKLNGNKTAGEYVRQHIQCGAFRRWRAIGLTKHYDEMPHRFDYPQAPWPVISRRATAVEAGVPENEQCPYSGLDSKFLLEIEGRIFGFCNQHCRDKTAMDPMAWPEFSVLL